MNWLRSLFTKKPAATPHTGATISRSEIAQNLGNAILADKCYARVNSAWLSGFYDDFRNVLFREGVTKWDGRFDCDDFARLYVGLANLRFHTSTFHEMTPAESLAVGEFWFCCWDTGATHAVVVAFTERGRIFIEPQSGKEIDLKTSEVMTAHMVKF